MGASGKRLTPDLLAKRWRSLMRVTLGAERAKQLSIQSGRRTYPLFAVSGGRALVDVCRDLGTTSKPVRQSLKLAGWPLRPAGAGDQPIRFATSIPFAKSRSA
jgi:hypothetical protein